MQVPSANGESCPGVGVGHQGIHSHLGPVLHWEGALAGVGECLQGWPYSSWATWKGESHKIPEAEGRGAAAAFSAGLRAGFALDA